MYPWSIRINSYVEQPSSAVLNIRIITNNKEHTMKYFTPVYSFLLTLFVLIAAVSPTETFAMSKTARTSATLVTVERPVMDNRAKVLRVYLEKHDSPLASFANIFVSEADKNQLDWKLVAAISGVESTFGKRIPYNSYNGWGWGVYGNNVLRFNAWDEAISTISTALREQYINKAGKKNIYEIGTMYAADPNWGNKVLFFMRQIEDFENEYTAYELSISI
ncbi:MAG: glucosaminidase domain-containing protein [Candidatus Levybacteria bacterium]|nr:glucosaminidase domain-containing protein [Candidatus Levybacteria bacterium]